MNPGTAALAAVLLALSPLQAAAAVVRDGQVVMGTVLTVTVVAEDSALAGRLAKEAVDEARRWDDALTIWRPEGELAGLNRSAGKGLQPLGPRLESGLRAMLRLGGATRGAFEPAVGRLPDRGDSSGHLAGIGRCLHLDGHGAFLDPGTVLDPGAIGKGLALDAMVAIVRSGGARAAFFDFGGSSQTAVGPPPGDPAGWSVLVAGLADGSSHGIVRLRDASLSTSRAGAPDTKPILDPRSGLPVPSPRLVTVRAAGAADADAWSTALVVLGRDGIADARKSGIAMLLEDAGGLLVAPGFGLERESGEGQGARPEK